MIPILLIHIKNIICHFYFHACQKWNFMHNAFKKIMFYLGHLCNVLNLYDVGTYYQKLLLLRPEDFLEDLPSGNHTSAVVRSGPDVGEAKQDRIILGWKHRSRRSSRSRPAARCGRKAVWAGHLLTRFFSLNLFTSPSLACEVHVVSFFFFSGKLKLRAVTFLLAKSS